MSTLTGKLTRAAGLGGVPSAGAQSTSTYGMGSQMAAASSTGSGILGDFKNASSDVRQGRISVAVLESMLILLVLFYIWTHNVQGGG